MESSRHKKTPTLAGDGASGVKTFDGNHDMNNSTAVSNVIPFRFEAKEVRSFIINEEPWFVASDVTGCLEYVNSRDAISKHVDADDRNTVAIRDGKPGNPNQTIINESGLYALIFGSDKAEAKRFKKWVTSEVLPSIRRHGHYVDHHSVMGDLVGAVIGTSGEHVLDRVIDQKASPVPHALQRSFKHTMKSRLRSRFNVQRTALIPAEHLADACNFVAAYALEGEWIGRLDKDGLFFNTHEVQHIYLLMCRHASLMRDREAILSAGRLLDSRTLIRVFDQINEGRSSFSYLDARRSEIYSTYLSTGCSPGGYAAAA